MPENIDLRKTMFANYDEDSGFVFQALNIYIRKKRYLHEAGAFLIASYLLYNFFGKNIPVRWVIFLFFVVVVPIFGAFLIGYNDRSLFENLVVIKNFHKAKKTNVYRYENIMSKYHKIYEKGRGDN